uniref:MADF domain-containing protein n=1 Tax=Nothobranchius furzeri TaxID=105023 RepID=A0A8C6PG82_NOTFU
IAASASLIQAVCNYPELYNVTLPNYRCTESRANAWRDISMALGDACKKRWKNLRDRYLKEVRLEIKTKKQGGFVQSKWKYRQLMNFIAPFTGSRVGVTDMCGNTEEERKNPDNVLGNEETTLSESVKTPQNITKVALSLPEAKPQVAFVTQLPALSQDIQLAVVAKTPPGPQVIPVNHTTSFSSRPRDEDELFLLSFVPALKRLAPQTRCETKMKIQQIMYEAEFSTSPDESQEKRTAAGTQDKS